MLAAESKADAKFGSWASPITAKFITTSGVRMGSISLDEEERLHWLEGRPQEGGRQVVVQYKPDDDKANERGAVDISPAEVNVRTRVHEYGGGAYVQAPGGGIIYSDFASQRLFWAKPGETEPICLSPESEASPNGRYRFADACIHPSKTHLIAVREDHNDKGDANPADVINEVVSLALDGSGQTTVLATGKDFYAHPRVSPDGASCAYVCWDHPAMPWDATQLCVAPTHISAGGVVGDAMGSTAKTTDHTLIAGADGDTSVLQPAWHPTSGALYYISDESGFWNLYRAPASLAAPSARCAAEADFGGSSPGWQFGQQGYTFLANGRCAATYTDTTSGCTTLLTFDDDDDDAAAEASALRYDETDGLPPQFGSVTPTSGDDVYLLGGSASAPGGVYKWTVPPVATGGASSADGEAATMLACSSSARLPDGYVSVPSLIDFPCPLGKAYGYYYAPSNAEFECTSEAAPPLLVKAHGGPTGATSGGFNPAIQFWTSRGFAVLDVDYGGSTGYGREYRRRLRGAWGIVDIDDVCAGAEHLVSQGLVDGKRLAIDGGSAGGYTTLGALAFKDVFTAGCSLYGVADLGVLAGDTHKFESRYLDGLVGPYPEKKQLCECTANCPSLPPSPAISHLISPCVREETRRARSHPQQPNFASSAYLRHVRLFA